MPLPVPLSLVVDFQLECSRRDGPVGPAHILVASRFRTETDAYPFPSAEHRKHQRSRREEPLLAKDLIGMGGADSLVCLQPAGNPAHIVEVGRGGENLIHRRKAIHLHNHFVEAVHDRRADPDGKPLRMYFGQSLQGMALIGIQTCGGECEVLFVH